jgi:hypothetical protein
MDVPTTRTVGLCFVILGAAIAALLPIFLVLYPAAGIGQADAGKPEVVLPVIARNPALFVGPGILELVGHAVGAAAIIGLWMRWGGRSFLLAVATLGGLVWMSVDAIDNAIGLQLVPALATSFVGGDAGARASFASTQALLDAVRLAGHFAGGLWVVGASVFAVRTGSVNQFVALAGIAAGVVLTLNPIVPALLNVSFMTLPVWLIAFGIVVARAEVKQESRLTPGIAMS